MGSDRETTQAAIDIDLLDRGAGDDTGLVERLAALINEVYAVAEEGLWQPGWERTNAAEVGGLVRAGEIATATVEDQLAGVVRVQALSDELGEFGMLAGDPERRGIGIGRELVAFSEALSRERGHRAMQLELLVPREWRHPSKVFLDEWYRRISYRVIRTTQIDDMYPDLAPQLATPCDFVVYEKPL